MLQTQPFQLILLPKQFLRLFLTKFKVFFHHIEINGFLSKAAIQLFVVAKLFKNRG